MSGWAKGDLALCVLEGRILCSSCGRHHTGILAPEKNEILKVVFMGSGLGSHNDCMALALQFEDGRIGLATRFRKIKPDTEGANEDDAAWLKDLLTKKVKA